MSEIAKGGVGPPPPSSTPPVLSATVLGVQPSQYIEASWSSVSDTTDYSLFCPAVSGATAIDVTTGLLFDLHGLAYGNYTFNVQANQGTQAGFSSNYVTVSLNPPVGPVTMTAYASGHGDYVVQFATYNGPIPYADVNNTQSVSFVLPKPPTLGNRLVAFIIAPNGLVGGSFTQDWTSYGNNAGIDSIKPTSSTGGFGTLLAMKLVNATDAATTTFKPCTTVYGYSLPAYNVTIFVYEIVGSGGGTSDASQALIALQNNTYLSSEEQPAHGPTQIDGSPAVGYEDFTATPSTPSPLGYFYEFSFSLSPGYLDTTRNIWHEDTAVTLPAPPSDIEHAAGSLTVTARHSYFNSAVDVIRYSGTIYQNTIRLLIAGSISPTYIPPPGGIPGRPVDLYSIQSVTTTWNADTSFRQFKQTLNGGFLIPNINRIMQGVSDQHLVGNSLLSKPGSNLNERFVQSGIEGSIT